MLVPIPIIQPLRMKERIPLVRAGDTVMVMVMVIMSVDVIGCLMLIGWSQPLLLYQCQYPLRHLELLG
jgi:hypothetical protein